MIDVLCSRRITKAIKAATVVVDGTGGDTASSVAAAIGRSRATAATRLSHAVELGLLTEHSTDSLTVPASTYYRPTSQGRQVAAQRITCHG